MGNFDQNSSYIPPLFAVFAQTLGQFPQNVGFCPDFLYIAHLGIPEIWAIARKDEFAQKSIFKWLGALENKWYIILGKLTKYLGNFAQNSSCAVGQKTVSSRCPDWSLVGLK
jgi:hypothetical protein